jgi:competence protein ComGC
MTSVVISVLLLFFVSGICTQKRLVVKDSTVGQSLTERKQGGLLP